jgi:hypothetical protein
MGSNSIGPDDPLIVQADLVSLRNTIEELHVARTLAGVKERGAIGVEQGKASRPGAGPVGSKVRK